MSAVSTWLLLIQTGSGGISQRHSMSLPSDQGERTSPRLSVRAPKLQVSSTKELGLDMLFTSTLQQFYIFSLNNTTGLVLFFQLNKEIVILLLFYR